MKQQSHLYENLSMYIVITRPEKQAEALAGELQERGIGHSIVAPMLKIVPCNGEEKPLAQALSRKPQAIIITSSNGAEALAALTTRRDIPIIAVGEASCDVARHYGFMAVSGGGDVRRLQTYIQQHYSPLNGPLLYASGDVVSVDLTRHLQHQAYHAEHIVLYHTHAIPQLPPALQQVLIARAPMIALFYSERTAHIFIRLVRQKKLETNVTQASAFALSSTIASALKELPWSDIRVASSPTQEAMIALFGMGFYGYNG